MNASTIRKQAEMLSSRRADALAEVESLTHVLIVTDSDLGPQDVEEVRFRLRLAENRLDELAEAELHAWDAYTDASQTEHEEYLAEQAQDYPAENVYGWDEWPD